VLEKLSAVSMPIILALNKIDLITDKTKLLPMIQQLENKRNFIDIFPISSTKNINIAALESKIISLLPERPALFDASQLVDRDESFFMAEIIREKIMRMTNQEVPYSAAVTIDQIKRVEKSVTSLKAVLHIHATIWVEKAGQKVIILGKQGERLKAIGRQARLELENKFKQKVFLTLWIKIKEGWSDDQKLLAELGM
jgi:GTPase